MFGHIARFFRSPYERFNSALDRVRGQFKRYKKAGEKAVSAATEFLSLPRSTNVFEPLTPVLLDSDRSRRYESELLSALNNDQVRNIAITGEYGAGKSSVIRTFVDRHPELTYTFVSLAAFGKDLDKERAGRVAAVDSPAAPLESTSNSSDQKAPEKKNDSDILTRIEETIVQQLLYAVPSGQLPKTRLKRIIQASSSIIWLRTIFTLLMAVAGLRLYVPTVEKLPNIDPAWLVEGLLRIPGWAAVVVLGSGALYLIFSALKLASLFSIDGFTIKGGKLETTHHGSVLHKNVDEIVYCFERSKIDVVVIEDLDRFGIHDVFTRLREINFIIKQSPQIKRPVYFIYALRDELFAVGEKTKFFDLIIPIIPVVNSENSREKMLELLRERQFNDAELGAGLDYALLETVCYFIDDMRLIKNIVNEYDMFSSIIGAGSGLKLDPNKLFAIIAIRNLHPIEYADLVRRRGAIYDVIHGFSDWRFQQSKQADDAYQTLREQKERRGQEIANSTGELRAYVWLELLKKAGVSIATHVQVRRGEQYSLKEFVLDEIFEAIFSQDAQLIMIAVNEHGQVYSRSSASIGAKELLMSTFYKKRYDLLQRTIVEIDSAIAEQRIEVNRINHQTFRASVKKDYGEIITQKLKGLDVINYLLRHGYIDTDYTDYFGYFYPGSLTSEDKNLLLSLRSGASVDVATVINAPEKVVKKLDTDDLSNGRGIIVALMDYLSNCPYQEPSMSHQRITLEIILRSGLEGHLDRVAEATEILVSGPTSPRFVQAVHATEPRLFRELLKAERFESAVSKQALIGAMMDGLEVAQIRQLESQPNTTIYDLIANLEDVSRLMAGIETAAKGWPWLEMPSMAPIAGRQT